MADEPAPADELNAPLGRRPQPKRRLKIPRAVPMTFAAMLGAAVAGFATWVVIVDDPLGGEPVAIVSTKAQPKSDAGGQPGSSPGNRTAQSPGQGGNPAGAPPAQPANGTQTVTIIDGSSGKRQEVPIAGPAEPQQGTAINAQLIEGSRHGPIPRIGQDGTRPSDAYAGRPAAASGTRIAIVIGRLGVSASASAEALAKLPAPITFAFTPYGTDLERWVARARGEGREVLLQAPLEPFDYPDNDPGPQTLLTSLTPEQNIDRLHWSMSRFQGYVGLSNYMGARFAGNEQAVTMLMRETAKRGLLYFDDGTASRGLSGQIASANNVPFAKADLVLDANSSPTEIDAALGRLEAIARERGSAIGSASAVPLSIDRIAKWAKAAAARGIVLVPVSAVATRLKSS
jgi:polysaccharide deacetylase 2 family uncharacterized protein YibQ